MIDITVSDLQDNFDSVLDDIAANNTKYQIIDKDKPIAVIVPYSWYVSVVGEIAKAAFSAIPTAAAAMI